MIRQVWNRVQLMVGQGVGVLIGTHKIQVRVLDDEVLENIDRVQPYGLSYKPKPGCQTYLVFPSGDRSHGFSLVQGDRRYTLELAGGEVALHDDQGQVVHMARDKIHVKSTKKIRLEAPDIEIHATNSFKFDVNGHGQKWDSEGVETWQDNDQPRPHHPHSPPEI